ncbi:MAG TPA: DUF4156 domain-containing protein [Rudaea sp.]|jgi:hypothetical protein|uniref:DUF4156 domain-containing protein n=1 Tax=Rudaea sp. TaxID=2136325 RepID=UPI002F9288E3
MRKVAFSTLLISVALLPAACTWVNPTVSGGSVRVAYDGNVSGCRDAGTVSVTVADKIAFYHRSELKVRDELETMARNEAAQLPADTIKPLNEPSDGAQRFQAYVCGRVQVHQRDASREQVPPPQDRVQTFPVKEH